MPEIERLIADPEPEARTSPDFGFAPRLVSLLGDRKLKNSARDTLVGYGQSVVDMLRDSLENPAEDRWVRRHIPATLARIPGQASMDILVATLQTNDRFLRFQGDCRHREAASRPSGADGCREPVERLALDEGSVYYSRLGSYYNLFVKGRLPAKAILAGKLRHWLIPALEHLPIEERITRGDALLRNRPRGVDATLRALIADPDPVVAAAAVDLVGMQGVRTLDVELDRLAAGRNVDRIVTDAVAWSVALRDGSRTDGRWAGALPAVAVVDRLRKLPLFASVSMASMSSVVLKIDREELFDLLGQRPELLR